ncbi:low molecular weight phosphotyrosine protein phosphatase [Herbiconiux moechotypicola]|uniref:protein-tyrosine-phosphatase n=1 Tax=Herbiconiux moechotypicola TaxID=637393 RepID=A0ABN3DAT2_9MICO|nr:low molecular weight protein-tyrosine-phosphatase [Herbiconiux moechotypicola]MCS5728926.1 low molecular weight phosphotyrosine protein phosphatase [Herbiconiux moechotypicola]
MTSDPAEPQDQAFRICMVCTGNICRSPMAEIVLRDLVEKAGLSDRVVVTSAGTGEWHVGEHADPRTVSALERQGFDGSGHRARQFDASWFDSLDLVIALDRSHERVLRSWARSDDDRQKVRLLLGFDADYAGRSDVPDPYYSDEAMFDSVLAMVEHSCRALFRQLEPAFRRSTPVL